MEILNRLGDPFAPLEFRTGEIVLKANAVDRNGTPIEDHLARIEEKLDQLLALAKS